MDVILLAEKTVCQWMGQGGVPSERGKLLDASAGIRKISAMSLHIQRFAIFKRRCSAVNISLKQWDKSQPILSKWAYIATDIKNAGRYMPVMITTLNGSKFNYTVEDLYLPII